MKERSTPLPELYDSKEERLDALSESYVGLKTETVTATEPDETSPDADENEKDASITVEPEQEPVSTEDWTPSRTSPKPYLSLVDSPTDDRPVSPSSTALVVAERTGRRGEARLHRRVDIADALQKAADTPIKSKSAKQRSSSKRRRSGALSRWLRWLLPAFVILLLAGVCALIAIIVLDGRGPSPTPTVDSLRLELEGSSAADIRVDGTPIKGGTAPVLVPLDGQAHTLELSVDGQPLTIRMSTKATVGQ